MEGLGKSTEQISNVSDSWMFPCTDFQIQNESSVNYGSWTRLYPGSLRLALEGQYPGNKILLGVVAAFRFVWPLSTACRITFQAHAQVRTNRHLHTLQLPAFHGGGRGACFHGCLALSVLFRGSSAQGQRCLAWKISCSSATPGCGMLMAL